jgi:hypothetical protein
MFLRDCQGIVGYRKNDFDFCHYIFLVFPYVTSIHFYTLFNNPIMPKGQHSLHPAEASQPTYAAFTYALWIVSVMREPGR